MLMCRVSAVRMARGLLDVYLLIAPPLAGSRPAFGIGTAGALAGAAGIVVLAFYRGIREAAPVPLNDPYLEESLHYHNA